MNSKISGHFKVNAEVLGITSAAGTTSMNYDMQNFDRAMIALNVQGTFTTVVVDLMESSGATVAGTSAAGGKAGIELGGAATLINSSAGVRQMTLTHDAGTTSESFYMRIGSGDWKTFTYTSSTALLNSTAWTTAIFYYGSTVASSANTGTQFAMDSLKTALASTKCFGNIFVFSTGTTATLGINLMDSATGNLGFYTTVAIPTHVVNQAVGAFDIQAEDLNSTANKRWISAKCGTASTGCDVAVTVIREAMYSPPDFPGRLST